jgi:lysophospholipase L1-like esterase
MRPPRALLRAAIAGAFALAAVRTSAFAGTGTAGAPAGAPATASARFEIPASDDGLPGTGPLRRYEWFRQLWSQRRSAWAGQVEQDQHALVFLGDSITQRWGDDLGGSFPGTKVANRGIGGDTTRGVLIRLREDVLALHPSGIVLLIGTNDLEEGAAPEVAAANLELILAAIAAHDPKVPVVLCLVMPSSAQQRRPAAVIAEINRLYRKAARRHPQVSVVDTWSTFADAEGDAKPAEFPDRLHPNGAGYAKWAAAIRPTLVRLGLAATGTQAGAQPTPKQGRGTR